MVNLLILFPWSLQILADIDHLNHVYHFTNQDLKESHLSIQRFRQEPLAYK